MTQSRKLKRSEQLEPTSKYELVARLAAGGMGAVYVGRHRSAPAGQALVAVKRAHAHLLEDPVFRKMFVAEARLAARIRHPNVVGVSDVDESDGELLIVMDYVEGASFAELLAAGQRMGRRLPPAVAIRVALDAILGLHAAHSARDDAGRLLGIVHRDVSPHNVLVGADGVSRIVDFGVAKAIDHEGSNTQSGVLKGKAAYMAPEYLKGKLASPQSDVFSMGIVVWEGLACKRLFRTDDEVETMQRILDPAPAPLLSDVVFVDPSIDGVLARALEKDPARRYPTAADFARDLEGAARALDLLATPAEVGVAMETFLGEQLGARRTLVAEALEALGERTVIARRRTAAMPMTPAAAAAVPAVPPLVWPSANPSAPPAAGAPSPSTTVAWSGPPIAQPMPMIAAVAQQAPSQQPRTIQLAPLPGSVFQPTPARLSRRPTLNPTDRAPGISPIAVTHSPSSDVGAPGRAAAQAAQAASARGSRLLPIAILGAMIAIGATVFGIVKLQKRDTPAAPAAAEPASTSTPASPATASATEQRPTTAAPPPDASAPSVAPSALPDAPSSSVAASESSAPATPPAVGRPNTPPAKTSDPRRTTFTPRPNPY